MHSGLKGLLKTINFLPSLSAGVIHTPREPTPTPHASHSHPLPFMLLCTHNPSLRRFKDSIRGGRQRRRCRYRSRRSISEFRRCDLIPIRDHMEPHGSGEGGREGEIRPGRQLVSQLIVVSLRFGGTCPSLASSPRRCHRSACDSKSRL